MRDLQDKFLFGPGSSIRPRKIVPHDGVCTQAISLGEPNLLEAGSVFSTGLGLVAAVEIDGNTPIIMGVLWLPRCCGTVAGSSTILPAWPVVQ